MKRIGIDLGGTKIEGVLLGEDLALLKRKRIPTKQEQGYDSIVDRMAGLVGELLEFADGPAFIGLCTPGAISIKTGRLKNSNTTCLIGKPLKEDLEEAVGKSLVMDNDANCFAMAESILGNGKGYQTLFGVIIGTGVGGGIIRDGIVQHGRMNIAGEWGHHTLHTDGRACYCGQHGCVETYLSGPALERDWYRRTGEQKSLPDIVSSLDNQISKDGLNWKEDLLNNFSQALANVIDILDPDAIVLGGGVSNLPFLYTEGRDRVYQKVFSDSVDTPILRNKLGDSAGVFGAAILDSNP